MRCNDLDDIICGNIYCVKGDLCPIMDMALYYNGFNATRY